MSYKLNVYISNDFGVGHMYIGLVDANGLETKYGFHPIEDGKPWPTYQGNGKVKINEQTSGANWKDDYKKSFDLNEQQYQAAYNKAQQTQQNPGRYVGGEGDGKNCVSFADQIASAAGQNQGVGNMFPDSELNDNLAGWYADMAFGDFSLLGYRIPGATIAGIMSGMVAMIGLGIIGSGAIGTIGMAGAIGIAAAGVVTLTPIALDLNGNSRIDLLSATASTNKVFFDIDNDNFREKTSWIAGVDGWLANIINTNSTNDNIMFDIQLAFC